MISPDDTNRILMRIEHAIATCATVKDVATAFMRILKIELPHFDWVGVYWLRGKELHLGPFEGSATVHERIYLGDGVCGTAVAEGTNQIVRDVRDRENYVACNATTRSEIVVLIRDSFGGVLGQIDADSNLIDAFDHTDEMLLEAVGSRLAAFARRRGGSEKEEAAQVPVDDE
jgi:L-methionine (R)-S-oxide reductase